MNEQMFKDIRNWEKEYLSMNNSLNKRQKELLEGAEIKSHEGMVYGECMQIGRNVKDMKIKKTLNL